MGDLYRRKAKMFIKGFLKEADSLGAAGKAVKENKREFMFGIMAFSTTLDNFYEDPILKPEADRKRGFDDFNWKGIGGGLEVEQQWRA